MKAWKRSTYPRNMVILLLIGLIWAPRPIFSGTCDSSIPPFISSGTPPNVLIILDNSNSMDESFHGEAAGSYSPASKSVAGKAALRDMIDSLKGQIRVGLMTYRLPSTVNSHQIHNCPYFVSYDVKAYCPTPSQACDDYAQDPTTENLDACTAACRVGNSSFDPTYLDAILGAYTVGSDTWKRYCSLIFPKTVMQTSGTGTNYYYKNAYPFYAASSQGTRYCYSEAYNSLEGTPWDSYKCYSEKSSSSDGNSGYNDLKFTGQLSPTDSDKALGYYDFGRRLTWSHVGPTWFANSSPGGGRLHIAIGDLVDTSGNPSTTFNSLWDKLNPTEDATIPPGGTDYMACSASDKNTCPYIVNAGLTPTAGTLQTVADYFKGSLSGFSTPLDIVKYSCRKNFIIYVTDGLPSVDAQGRETDPATGQRYTADKLINMTGGVLDKLGALRALPVTFQDPKFPNNPSKKVTYNFDVKTYVLGVGLSKEAKIQLDRMAIKGGTAPVGGHAYYADDKDQLIDNLKSIFIDILGRAAAGTSISILSEKARYGIKEGSNMMQAVFYPTKLFPSKELTWTGYLYNYWFFSSKTKSSIFEDTVHDYILNLKSDYGLGFNFDKINGLTVTRKQDTTDPPDGEPERFIDEVSLDELRPIWEAGDILHKTAASSRKIYTVGTDGTHEQLIEFDDTANAGTMFHSLQTATAAGLGSTLAEFPACLAGESNPSDVTLYRRNLLSYIRGQDNLPFDDDNDAVKCRDRTVTLDGTTGTWKLGDIVYSTPKVEADFKYCHNGNFLTTPCSSDSDCTAGATCKDKESIVFVGANDGMLHAFKTGVLSQTGLNRRDGQVARLEGIPTSDMGKELWAFIPKNSLPYLRCLADSKYCHVAYVDLSPYITDMKVFENGVETVRKVLIGGMRMGGSSCTNTSGSSYTCGAPQDTCSATIDCSDPNSCYNPAGCTGLSSYFALDITDPETPKFLWEFTHPMLGFSFSGPAVIQRIENTVNGPRPRNYVMFLSGPTKRDGTSTEDLRVFSLTLDEQLKIAGLYVKNDLNIKSGFGGRLFTNGLDMNNDGNTDFVFFGFSKMTGNGWQGGLAKVYTGTNSTGGGLDPANWEYNVQTFMNIPQVPITAKVEVGKCFRNWYLYAGSGRYFDRTADTNYTTSNQADIIMSTPFFCKADNTGCSTVNSAHGGSDACGHLTKLNGPDPHAWYVELERPVDTGYGNERMITDPSVTNYQDERNIVFYTTSEPTAEPCGFGGQSRVWGLNCATGYAISSTACPGYSVTAKGVLYLQTSTGAIHKIDPTQAFTQDGDDRNTGWFEGMPPETAPPFVPPAGVREGKVLHWIEK